MQSDANKIQMLQKCDGYSPVFNLVLPSALDSPSSPPPLSPTEFPGDRSPETDAALSDIQQQVCTVPHLSLPCLALPLHQQQRNPAAPDLRAAGERRHW